MLALNKSITRSAVRSSSTATATRRSLSASQHLPRPILPSNRAASSPALARLSHSSSSSNSQAFSRLPASTTRMTADSHSRSPSSSRQLATAVHSGGATAAPPSALAPELLPPGYELRDDLAGVKAPAPYAVFTRDLEIPSRDDMKYRLIKLANGLEALVIQDEKADKASAAMDIRVGHLSDPAELQGLAHFCEHLLFMGTRKYPRENEYSEFLSNHSGGSNAYTGMDNTNYFFDVGPDHLEGALDRFAQFFLEPLFDPSCSEREIRAVDSEHKKNLQSDMWRSFQLEKTLSDPKHPFSHFGTGNYQTLWENPRSKGLDVRDELLKFHDRYYSANVMKLVVLGRDSLDTLTSWVVDKFSGVRNTGREPPSFPSSPLGPEQLQKQIFFRSVRDVRVLRIAFPIPDQGPLFRSKPSHFLAHFIGHEGEGSILSHLKKKGWCQALSAGATDGANGFQFFKLSIELTDEGFANHEKVLEAVFKYILLLKSNRLEEWAHREVAQLSELAFRFRDKADPADYASAMATEMQMPYPREWIVSGAYLTRDFDLATIQHTLDKLDPSNCRVTLSAKTLPDGTTEWEEREKWYGTEYTMRPLPQRLLQLEAAKVDFEDLALPKPNSFIPTNFDLKGPLASEVGKSPAPRPQLISHSPAVRVWHKRDDQFGMPKANLFLVLRNPLINASPATAVRARLLVELINDILTEYSYDASLAGLGYQLDSQDNSLALTLGGYNDKLDVLLQKILHELVEFKVDPRRFEILKDRVRRQYTNFDHEEPFRHAHYYLTYLLQETMWTPREKLAELEHVRAADIQSFQAELLQRMHVEVLGHGNMDKAEVQRVADTALTVLNSRPVHAAELVSQRSLILPPSCNYTWTVPVGNPANINSAIEYYCQVGDPTDVALRARLSLLAQIAHEPAFDQLRTKEQLGYLVFSGARRSAGTMGFRILVQSERSAPYLESRIEAFLDQLQSLLTSMTDDEFAAHKKSVIHKKLQKAKNLSDESHAYWNQMFSGKFDFLVKYADVEAIARLTKGEVVELFNAKVHPSARERSKVSVHVAASGEAVRFSAEASERLQAAVEAQGVPVPAEAFEALKAQQPAVESVKDLAQQALAQSQVPQDNLKQMLDLIDSLAAQFPLKTRDADQPASTHTTHIKDPVTFKASMTPSKAAVPARSWDQLAQEPADEADLVAERTAAVLAAVGVAKANL